MECYASSTQTAARPSKLPCRLQPLQPSPAAPATLSCCCVARSAYFPFHTVLFTLTFFSAVLTITLAGAASSASTEAASPSADATAAMPSNGSPLTPQRQQRQQQQPQEQQGNSQQGAPATPAAQKHVSGTGGHAVAAAPPAQLLALLQEAIASCVAQGSLQQVRLGIERVVL